MLIDVFGIHYRCHGFGTLICPTPQAAAACHTDMVKFLIQQGASIDLKDWWWGVQTLTHPELLLKSHESFSMNYFWPWWSSICCFGASNGRMQTMRPQEMMQNIIVKTRPTAKFSNYCRPNKELLLIKPRCPLPRFDPALVAKRWKRPRIASKQLQVQGKLAHSHTHTTLNIFVFLFQRWSKCEPIFLVQ